MNILLLKDFISSFSPSEPSFHIFFTGKDHHGDIDFQNYNYDTRRYGLPKIGDWFVYRRKDKKKFEFFGGGQIANIVPHSESSSSEVQAIIKNPFLFITPLHQGDPYLENFEWKHKKRFNNGWGHFFSQYGMNKIHENDFLNLFGNIEISPIFKQSGLKELSSELDPISLNSGNFSIAIEDLNLHPIKRRSKDKINKAPFKINYLKKAETNQTLGKVGEELILSLLKEDEEFKNSKITYMAAVDDSVGYDIEVEKPSGYKIYIEVKTSTGSSQGDFYISSNELKVGREARDYRIYRLYNFNSVNHSSNLVIFKDPFNSGILELTPINYKAKLESNLEEEK